jgi:hypothetical protein
MRDSGRGEWEGREKIGKRRAEREIGMKRGIKQGIKRRDGGKKVDTNTKTGRTIGDETNSSYPITMVSTPLNGLIVRTCFGPGIILLFRSTPDSV